MVRRVSNDIQWLPSEAGEAKVEASGEVEVPLLLVEDVYLPGAPVTLPVADESTRQLYDCMLAPRLQAFCSFVTVLLQKDCLGKCLHPSALVDMVLVEVAIFDHGPRSLRIDLGDSKLPRRLVAGS